ncbi:restriction endonuclease [Aeromonas enteropelogenes]|uniref:restriction endonuclease n=1 Tax=Aeromonas enteropelogenes TaxID=29489 RepID=UPI003B9E5DD0
MDAEMYAEAIEYELLTQAIYRDILVREGVSTANVHHNVSIAGRSGVEHQVDVYWEFRQAGITHRVLIECKNYASNLTLEKARNFFAVVHDIGNCVGIMVTKTGYQSGAAAFCKYYGLALKLLRKPVEEDWEGRIKEIHINMIPRVPVSNETHPIVCSLYLRPASEEQELRLKNANGQSPELVHANPSMRFLGKDGQSITEELRWWIPRQLNVLEREDGGPYKQPVELTDHYISADLGNGIELVQVIGVVIDYYVETLQSHQVVLDATETVSAILKDFESGEWEHVHRAS